MAGYKSIYSLIKLPTHNTKYQKLAVDKSSSKGFLIIHLMRWWLEEFLEVFHKYYFTIRSGPQT